MRARPLLDMRLRLPRPLPLLPYRLVLHPAVPLDLAQDGGGGEEQTASVSTRLYGYSLLKMEEELLLEEKSKTQAQTLLCSWPLRQWPVVRRPWRAL